MWLHWPHNSLIVYYTYKLLYLFLGSRWIHICYGFYPSIYGFTPSHVTQKPKYPISVCLKNYFSILHLSSFSFILLSINYSFYTWSVQSTLVKTNRSSMNTRMNSNPWNKSFIFYWKMSGEFETPIVRRLYWYSPPVRIIVHKLLAFLLIWIW